MGEATFYLKAEYPTAEAATKAGEKLTALWKENAADWWQEHRGYEPEYFWPQFQERFPVTTEYLKHFDRFGGDCNNDLAGQLCFPGCDGAEDEVTIHENLVMARAFTWHLGDWNPLVAWLKGTGAQRAGWLSDEYADDYFSMIEME
ncbi:MAG: hypothetical protein K0S79_125 [Nitrospira sp.]|jgi:hypothetical protein|nr:hypothetical protein [Nitrospira sp.]